MRIEEVGGVTIIEGGAVASLRLLDDQSVNCCVTSPPYFGLRDYGHEDQIGLEKTPDEYVANLVAVFREVRRVLRDDGVLWLNLGDSYARNGGAQGGGNRELLHMEGSQSRMLKIPDGSGLKPKDLIGIPWRVAFALQADSWYLRQDIIWHKPNPMPESVRDRCTKSHEYIFLLSKSAKYYFDSDAMQEPANKGAAGSSFNVGKTAEHQLGRSSDTERTESDSRNKRDVWTVATTPYKGAHFAVFPPKLIEPCILAGCPVGGVVLDPFGGSGTTGMVAQHHGRQAVLLELNPAYVDIAMGRIMKGML